MYDKYTLLALIRHDNIIDELVAIHGEKVLEAYIVMKEVMKKGDSHLTSEQQQLVDYYGYISLDHVMKKGRIRS